jgi:hypothetical protein
VSSAKGRNIVWTKETEKLFRCASQDYTFKRKKIDWKNKRLDLPKFITACELFVVKTERERERLLVFEAPKCVNTLLFPSEETVLESRPLKWNIQ